MLRLNGGSPRNEMTRILISRAWIGASFAVLGLTDTLYNRIVRCNLFQTWMVFQMEEG